MCGYYKMRTGDAKAIMHNCPVSRKLSVELAREIRCKPAKKVEKFLEDIIALKRHVPLKRYFHDVGHKKGPAVSGVKAGRYPVKVAKYFKKILKMALSNADYNGLDVNKPMFVKGCVISQGIKRFGFQSKGHRRLRRDQTVNIEIVVKQLGKIDLKKKEIKQKSAEAKKEELKKEEKKETVKEEKKEEFVKTEEKLKEKIEEKPKEEKEVAENPKKVWEIAKELKEKKVERKVVNKDTEIIRPKK